MIDVLKADLKKQLEHFKSLSDTRDKKEHDKGMVRGAEICMDIIKDFWNSHRGTVGYLKTLDTDQLEFAASESQKMLENRLAEKKVELWVVSNDCINVGHFLGFDAAADCLRDTANKELKSTPNMSNKFTIDTVRVFESEVKDYIEG